MGRGVVCLPSLTRQPNSIATKRADGITVQSCPASLRGYETELQNGLAMMQAVLHWCKCLLQRCEAILQPCNAQCNGARPICTTARGFCDDARRNCTETANFRRPAGNKKRRAAFVSVINF